LEKKDLVNGDLETWGKGDLLKRGLGDLGKRRLGDEGTVRKGDLENWGIKKYRYWIK